MVPLVRSDTSEVAGELSVRGILSENRFLVTQFRMVPLVRSGTTGVVGGLIAAGEQIDCPVLINRFRPLCLDHCCGDTGLPLYAAVLMDLTC